MKNNNTTKPRVWVALTAPNRTRYFTRDTARVLRSLDIQLDMTPAAGLSAAAVRRRLGTADALITCRQGFGLTPELLDAAPRLRFIGMIGSSVKAISPEQALARNITLTNSAHGIGYGVAEFAVGLMVTALHNVFPCRDSVRTGGWGREIPHGHELRGRSVGLVGLGSVGRQVVELLQPFRTTVRVHDPYLDRKDAAALGVEAVSLNVLLRTSDVVSIHCGLTPETRGLIGAKELQRMRPGALLINTARGPILDASAVLEALQAGRIQAALDVFEQEPLPPDSPFRTLPNCITTPHKPGGTVETYLSEGRLVVEDLGRFLAGKEPVGRIDAAKLSRMT